MTKAKLLQIITIITYFASMFLLFSFITACSIDEPKPGQARGITIDTNQDIDIKGND